MLLLALQLTGVSARPAALVTIGCLLAYAQVVGSEASVARATFAAATFLAARAVNHRSAPLNTVALSATCLLAVSPLLAGLGTPAGAQRRFAGGSGSATETTTYKDLR